MTVGQLSFYDQVKETLLSTVYFNDDLLTHFLSSLTAVFFLQFHSNKINF